MKLFSTSVGIPGIVKAPLKPKVGQVGPPRPMKCSFAAAAVEVGELRSCADFSLRFTDLAPSHHTVPLHS